MSGASIDSLSSSSPSLLHNQENGSQVEKKVKTNNYLLLCSLFLMNRRQDAPKHEYFLTSIIVTTSDISL